MKRSLLINGIPAVGISLGLVCGPVLSAPTREEVDSALTACAAGSNFKLDADVTGGISMLYDKEAKSLQGKAEVDMEGILLKVLPDAAKIQGYQIYVDCIKTLLRP
jgi:hypothetical protein